MPITKGPDGPLLQVLHDAVRVKLPSSDSPNGMSVVAVEVAPGGGTPAHSHPAAEEGYYMLQGRLQLLLGEHWHELAPGDFAHVPPGTVHAYENRGSTPVSFLAWTVGGAMDRFFADVAAQVRQLPEDLPRLERLLQEHAVQLAQR